jgi:hypothetical protein
MMSEQITQRLAFANGVVPQTLNNATANTNAVDLSLAHRAFFALYIGAVTGGGSITATLQESPDNSAWSNLSGSSVSQSGLTTSNKLTTFEVRADQLTKRYVRLQVQETGAQNVLVGCTCWSDEGIHKPNNANNGTHVGTQNVVS